MATTRPTASAAHRVATFLGVGFLLIGVLGFVFPTIFGMHLSVTHSIIHLVSGAVSLWIGLKMSVGAVKTFCIVFGAVYGLLGVAGFILGRPMEMPVGDVPGYGGPYMWPVIPGVFEVGAPDHVVHILLGAIYVIGGLMTRTPARTETAAA